MKLFFKILFMLILFRATGAQTTDEMLVPLRSEGPLVFDLDVCQFAWEGNLTKCEFIYSIPLNQLQSTADDKAQLTTFKIQFLISKDSEIICDSTMFRKVAMQTPLLGAQEISYIDLIDIWLPFMEINFSLRISDSLSGKWGEIPHHLFVRNLNHSFSLSDLYFISKIQKAEQKGFFEKHGLLLIPNPARQFNKADKYFHIYYELNQMFYEEDEPSSFNCRYEIYDLSGNEIFHSPDKISLKKSANTSRIEKIDLTNLPVGTYLLKLMVRDEKLNEMQQSSRYFAVWSAEEESQTWLPVSEEESDKYFDQIKYIATKEEKNVYKKLDLKGRQEFLLKFWKVRDTNPDTPRNEFMEDHFRKIALVQKSFAGGINSDMGRIYIQYGAPVQIEEHPISERNVKAYVIWRYGTNGLTEFVFIDRVGDDHYFLVHSTHPNEISNPDWMEELKAFNLNKGQPFQINN